MIRFGLNLRFTSGRVCPFERYATGSLMHVSFHDPEGAVFALYPIEAVVKIFE